MSLLSLPILGFSFNDLLRGLILCVLLWYFQRPSTPGLQRYSSWAADSAIIGGFFLIFLLARVWLSFVTEYVPEPYLDEVFHIPQAQTYCQGQYFEWDDKITTPPGLYLIAVISHKLRLGAECTAFTLRNLNIPATLQIALIASLCRNALEARAGTPDGRPVTQTSSWYSYHTALNIALFPPLFFFSSLFYTDVASTLSVLLAYQHHLGRISSERTSILSDIVTVVIGVVTLFMRQTNVFWVVVYMGGLEAVHAIRSLNTTGFKAEAAPTTLLDTIRSYWVRYSEGNIHDPPLSLSYPDDWVFCLLSLAIAAIHNPTRVIKQIWPHITILGLFTGFVAWNGSVVLGDKSNHVATVHLAQLLYIWPLFAFFSAPLLISPLLAFVCRAGGSIFGARNTRQLGTGHDNTADHKSAEPGAPLVARAINAFIVRKLYYIPFLLGTVVFSLAIVKFNTIIHPFTLADNRHYMFYVFRYTIRRPGSMRYYLVAAYTFSRCMIWSRLAGLPLGTAPNNSTSSSYGESAAQYINTPFPTDDIKRVQALREVKLEQEHPDDPAKIPVLSLLSDPRSFSSCSPPTSTVILWLLTTTLSLVTAPLVEPRYFILPWVFWRLLVPAWPPHARLLSKDQQTSLARVPILGWLVSVGEKADLTLVLETLWFLVINLGTMYVFLFKPFQWFSAEGELLDGGRQQRFMW